MSAQKKVAVVTGAGRGIGFALVEEFLRRGYKVICAVRNAEDVQKLCSLDANNVVAVECDIVKPEAEGVLQEFLKKNTTHVDVLVNNAGFGATGYGISGLIYSELDNVLAVHCYGPIRCVRAALELLRQSRNGAIINISSRFGSLEWVATGTVPHKEATYPYRIGKAALNMLTSCLAVELGEENIRVFSVDPGKVKTRFGPRDADTEPAEAARAIVDLFENSSVTATFVHASGDKVPW